MSTKMDRLRKLYTSLLGILEQYGTGEIDNQIGQVKRILEFLNGFDSSIENEDKHISKIRNMHKSLFPPRGGLSDFFIWSNDYDERIRLNEPLENVQKEINDILNN